MFKFKKMKKKKLLIYQYTQESKCGILKKNKWW